MTVSSLKGKFLFALAGAFLLMSAGLASAEGPYQLQGSWSVQVTLRDCDSGQQMGPAFSSLATFSKGGTTTDTTANPAFFPAERSPGHGTWSKTGWRTYQASSTAFITLNGALAKTQVIRQEIKFGDLADQYSSNARVQFFDPSGNLLVTGCATAEAQRLK